jgi:hypothetical protein
LHRLAASDTAIATFDTAWERTMKIQSAMAALLLGGVLAAPVFAPAFAQTPAQNAQQQKMKTCNAQAADKKGDDRKAFMKQCLSTKG